MLEFGLRRAQGIDGAVWRPAAPRTSAAARPRPTCSPARCFGIPVRGTHAHSWVMSFDSELEAFEAYAERDAQQLRLPGRHLRHARRRAERRPRRVARSAQRGHEMLGIRLDSGDLAYLSREARRILDEAGFPDAAIVASNDLDEHIIASLKDQGAAIGVWGVGTRLVTGCDQPALGGVYKLGAIRRPGEPWSHRLKLSEQAVKVSNPGILQVRRYGDDRQFLADVIYDEETGIGDGS